MPPPLLQLLGGGRLAHHGLHGSGHSNGAWACRAGGLLPLLLSQPWPLSNVGLGWRNGALLLLLLLWRRRRLRLRLHRLLRLRRHVLPRRLSG